MKRKENIPPFPPEKRIKSVQTPSSKANNEYEAATQLGNMLLILENLISFVNEYEQYLDSHLDKRVKPKTQVLKDSINNVLHIAYKVCQISKYSYICKQFMSRERAKHNASAKVKKKLLLRQHSISLY